MPKRTYFGIPELRRNDNQPGVLAVNVIGCDAYCTILKHMRVVGEKRQAKCYLAGFIRM